MQKNQLQDAVVFLRKHPSTYLATVQDSKPWVRAMQIASVDDDGTIWYATGLSTNKVGQIRENPQVCISIYEAGTSLRIFGVAEIITASELKDKFWQESWSTFFTSRDDPEYVLIRVLPQTLELH
jgi:general stress protein 26